MSVKPLGIDFGINQPQTSPNSDDAMLVPVTLSNQHAGTAVEARAILRSVGFSETDLNSEQGKKLLSEVEAGLSQSTSNYSAGKLVYDSVNKQKVWQAYIKVSNQNLEHFKNVLAEIRAGDRNAQIDTAGPQGKLEQMRADAAMRNKAIQGGELGTVSVIASAEAIPLEFPGSLPTITLPSAVEMVSAVAETVPPVALMSSALAAPAITAAHYAEKYVEMQQAAVLEQADAAYRALEIQDLANLPPFGNNQPLPPPALPVTPDQSEQGRKLSVPLTTPAAPPNVVTSTPPMSNSQPLPPPPPIINPQADERLQHLVNDLMLAQGLHGIGTWSVAEEPMSDRAAAYQEQITGQPAGVVYVVNNVRFDGYKDGVLQDAKGPGYANFIKDGAFQSWWLEQGGQAMISDAKRQVAAAAGTPIVWYVAEGAAAQAIGRLLAENGYDQIQVKHTPSK